MTGKEFLFLVAAILLLAARHSGGADAGPLSFDERRHTTRLFEPFGKPPPAAWYKAIEVPPVRELLQKEECYAVVRVEHGFNQGLISGHYLIVTLSFKKPQLEVVSKSLRLPKDGRWGLIHGLWRGRAKDEGGELTDEIRRLLRTEKRSFMPGEGEHRGRFTSTLNRLGIGTLPSVLPAADHAFIPVRSFVKFVEPDGTVRWRATLSGGGSKGGPPLWRFSACWRRRDQEKSHEFCVIGPFGINDLRYERLLLEIAKHSAILKAFLEEKYKYRAALRAERANSAKKKDQERPAEQLALDTQQTTSEPQDEAATDRDAETQQENVGEVRRWPLIASAFVGGLALGAAGSWLLLRRRAA